MVDISILLLTFLPGMVGGLVRGLVGVSKNVIQKNRKFSFPKMILSLVIATITGGVAGIYTQGDWMIALLAGYAGSDFLEAIYKTRIFSLFK